MSVAATTLEGWEVESTPLNPREVWTGSAPAPLVNRQIAVRPEAQWSGAVPVGSNTVLEEALRGVQELAALGSNWDGYGSPRIHPAAIEGTLNLLRALVDTALPPPDVSPVSGGGIQIEWERAGRELEIVFRADGTVAFLAEGPGVEKEGILRPEQRRELLTLLVWLSE